MTASSKETEALRFCPSSPASISSSTRPSFRGHTLLLPTISHASIPQLATDLLLSTGTRLALVHVGSLDVGQDLIPFIGGSDSPSSSSSSSSGGISTPLDVFTSTRYPLTVLQQRSPVLRSRRAGFAKRLARWVRKEGFARVVVLSSLDAALRDDEELGAGVEGDDEEAMGGMMHHLPSAAGGEGEEGEENKKLAAALKRAGPPVSSRVLVGGGPSADQDDDANALPVQLPSSSASRQTPSSQPHLPSSSTGLTSRYLSALSDVADSTNTPVPSGALLLWAAEGDNRGDAHRMAKCVLEEVLPALGVETSSSAAGGTGAGGGEAQQLNEPPSWKGLYGNAYDQALFG